MTMTTTRPFRWYKTDPDCPGDRHRANHKSYIRGCRCAATIAAQQEWLQRPQRTYRNTAHALPVDGDPACPGRRHTPTRDSWRLGCRCPGACAAQDAWRKETKAARVIVLEHFRRTGECTARVHDSRWAYVEWGCRCPLSVKLHVARVQRKPKQKRVAAPEPPDSWRLPVSRNGLLMLLAGYPDRPTMGEYLAADIRLGRVYVPDGPRSGRRLFISEVAERLHCSDATIRRARRERDRLREERHLRRLADVRAKAERVARHG